MDECDSWNPYYANELYETKASLEVWSARMLTFDKFDQKLLQ